ncbi:choice-of-anchor E domain-containing protein [Anabaena sp. UHCC 0451]|uniref:choice-of-anchor E domain-containing protein n=1 Tax=Anabaena sp. UHCC 0451 TaxID=2055235 RepID=UPI002B201E86|nr:choice-of-anchor E domain-containing protein [Anabaena sp. UHCC 0451]MEA5575430.1 choice-of-anchor E domain-containing protein [Anabaena sp. UHCC 0451]
MNSTFSPPKALAILATASLASLAISPKAEAISLLSTQTQSFTNQLTELSGNPVLTFNQYNGPDTLEEVVFTVTASLTSSGTVTNNAANPQNFIVTLIPSQYDLNAASGAPAALLALLNPNTSGTFSPLNDSNITQIGPQSYSGLASGATANFGPFTVNGASSATFNTLVDVAGFVGAGSYSFDPFTSIGTLVNGGGGNVATNITTLASASIQVQYFGTPSSNPPAEPVPFGFSTNASLLVFGGVFYGFNKLKKNMAVKKSQA